MAEIQDERVVKQQTIEVREHSLVIACTADGTRYLSVSAICKALNIDHRTQLRRIRNTDELSSHLRQLVLHFLSGGDQPVFCLPVEFVEPWLSSRTGLQTDTIKPSFQPLLQLFRQDLLRIIDEACPLSPSLPASLQASWFQLVDSEPDTTSKAFVVSTEQSKGADEEVPLAAQHVLEAHLPPTAPRPALVIPLYMHAEHTAFREASVAKAHRWTREEDSEEDPHFLSPSTQLQVFVTRPSRPIGLDAAMKRIAQLGPSTVLTARIGFGLWNARRRDSRYAESGWVAIAVEEFLLLRNLQMHTRAVRPDSDYRVSDGAFERKYLERLQRDLELLNESHIRRWVTPENYYDSPYLRVGLLMERPTQRGEKGKKEKDKLVRVAVSPGEWMPQSYHSTFDLFTAIDERVFSLSLKSDVYAILLGLYLTERWRQQALQFELAQQARLERGSGPTSFDPFQPFQEMIRIRDLLELSVIDVDHANLTTRFAPAIESAFQKLFEQKILAEPVNLPSLNKEHNWGSAWLNTHVLLLPNLMIQEHQRTVIVEEAYQLSLLPGPVEKNKRRKKR